MAKTFYNADRTLTATIDFAEDVDVNSIFDDALASCCEVYLGTDFLSGVFGIESETDFNLVNRRIDEARRVGDRVFFIEIYSHGGYSIRITPYYRPLCKFDSGLNGVIIVQAGKWKKHISPIFTSAYVQREMDRLAEWITAYVNGSLFEFHSDVIYGPFLSEEEAEEVLHEEYPELIFTDEDFNCECIYTLKADAYDRLNSLSPAQT